MDAEDIRQALAEGTLEEDQKTMEQIHKFPWPLEIVEADLTAVTRDLVEGGAA
jgi:hypothetical protein